MQKLLVSLQPDCRIRAGSASSESGRVCISVCRIHKFRCYSLASDWLWHIGMYDVQTTVALDILDIRKISADFHFKTFFLLDVNDW